MRALLSRILPFIENLKDVNITLSSSLYTLLAVYLLTRVQKVLNGRRAVGYLPGFIHPFQPYDLPAALFPSFTWNAGINFMYEARTSLFQKYQNETVSYVPIFNGTPGLITTSLEVMRQVMAAEFVDNRHWGMNVLAARGEVWRKHRRIAGPAFSNELYKAVWEQTLSTYYDMISTEGWDHKEAADTPIVHLMTSKLALLIICKCGFGLPYNWAVPPKVPGQTMSFQEAVRIVADNIITVSSMPKWFIKLPIPAIKNIRAADEELLKFLRVQVKAKQATASARGKANQYEEPENIDIFTLLAQANKDESGKLQLDENELIGNVFIMLFAGHETTAHGLANTFALLAVNDDVQNEIFEQIISVVETDRDPKFEDYTKLDKVLAAFYEALRMYSPIYMLMREASTDTIITIPNPMGEEGNTRLPISKGTLIFFNVIGMYYNPRYFEDPETYKPSRWYGVSADSEAFPGFNIGPRACIGRKFATTEAVCFLTMVLRDWRVEPMLSPGETLDDWKKKVFSKPNTMVTLGIGNVPLRFIRRASQGVR